VKKIVLTMVAVAALAGAVAVVWAQGWMADGSGSGTVSAGTACLEVTVGTTTDVLVPNGEVSVPVEFHNCGSVGLDIQQVDVILDDGLVGICNLWGNHEFHDDLVDDHNGALGSSHVAPLGTPLDTDTGDTIKVFMGGDAADDCQGATFALTVDATGWPH
jgi:hypothetical protein